MTLPILPLLALLPQHVLPDGVVERGVQVIVRADEVQVECLIGLSSRTASELLRESGIELAPGVSPLKTFRSVCLQRLARGVRIEWDGRPLKVRSLDAREVRRDHYRVQCNYSAQLPQRSGVHRLTVRDENGGLPGRRVIALKARDEWEIVAARPAGEVLMRQTPQAWRRLNPVQRELTRRVTAVLRRPAAADAGNADAGNADAENADAANAEAGNADNANAVGLAGFNSPLFGIFVFAAALGAARLLLLRRSARSPHGSPAA